MKQSGLAGPQTKTCAKGKLMKLTLALLVMLGLAVGIGIYSTRDRHAAAAPSETLPAGRIASDGPTASVAAAGAEEKVVTQAEGRPPVTPRASVEAIRPATTAPGAMAYQQALETLVSATATYSQKEAAWGQLRDAGKLDQVIGELEARAAKEPGRAELTAVLGQAYLHKAGAIQDVREQGILGMKADQSFEVALSTDPQNWDARFWRATAMSYWPAQLGKGKEVIENCLELLKQQEVLPPKPEYAQVYVLLGTMYEREGFADYAQQTWKRGLGLFPGNEALASKVTPGQ
jgi:tetratricopeptide (TPR) repeat protein